MKFPSLGGSFKRKGHPGKPDSPEVPLEDPVEALVEGPGGVVAGPVVVVAVGVGEEVPGERLEHALLLPGLGLWIGALQDHEFLLKLAQALQFQVSMALKSMAS